VAAIASDVDNEANKISGDQMRTLAEKILAEAG
jgi:hypothetical protein